MKKIFRILKSIGIFILASTLLTAGSEFAYEAFDFCLGESSFFGSRVYAAEADDSLFDIEGFEGLKGFNIGSFLYEKVEDILNSQFELDECYMLVDFHSLDEWSVSVNVLIENDSEVLEAILTELDCLDGISYTYDETGKNFFFKIQIT